MRTRGWEIGMDLVCISGFSSLLFVWRGGYGIQWQLYMFRRGVLDALSEGQTFLNLSHQGFNNWQTE